MVKKIIKYFLSKTCPHSFVLGRVEKLHGLVLTFDDGPHPTNTSDILQTLAERNIKAIFFVTGCQLKKYPELGRKIVEYGHLIGNHTYDHLNIKKCTYSEYKKSIEKTEENISLLYSDRKYQKLFRPPFSSFSIRLLVYIFFSRYLLVNWTIDSRDSFILQADSLVKYVNNLKLCNGDILLFHEDYSQTVEALPEILDHIQDQGFEFDLPVIN